MSLSLFIGPMYAGKTSELIRQIQRHEILGQNILVINHSINQRYGSSTITTHTKLSYDDCIIMGRIGEVYENEDWKRRFETADVIVIEELQFFPDAYDHVVQWCDVYKKNVIACGLDGDFRRQPFGDVLRLIPHAEKVIKLKALCKRCGDGTEASFTKRTVADDAQTRVGSDDVYEAVCRKHFLARN